VINVDTIVHVIMWVVAVVLIFIASVNISIRWLMPRERKMVFDEDNGEKGTDKEAEREV
tara:strand:+ start:434 stop:610 length:177 start_codon:yes stop_codon:yes gene_type:complete